MVEKPYETRYRHTRKDGVNESSRSPTKTDIGRSREGRASGKGGMGDG